MRRHVAEDETGIVAFLARRGEEIRLLYTGPDRIGMGAGTQLIDAAKTSGVNALELWCFQATQRARRFYETRGFRAIRFTDGADNEERMPDVQLSVGTQVTAVIIRGEKKAYFEAIHELVAAAFWRPDEAVLIDGACVISLVAVESYEIVDAFAEIVYKELRQWRDRICHTIHCHQSNACGRVGY